MPVVELRVTGFFGGTEQKTNRHGNKVYYPIATFEIPEEPSAKVASLIRNNKKGEPVIMATVTTTDRALTEALFGILAQDGEEFDFEIDEPREGKVPGYMKKYPRPGDFGFSWPEHLPDPLEVRDQLSGGEGELNTETDNQDNAQQRESTIGGGTSEPATPVGLSEGNTPSSPDTTATDADWENALVCYDVKTKAPIIKDLRARRKAAGNDEPVKVGNMATEELDAAVEAKLAEGDE